VDGGSAQCVPDGTRLAQLGAQLENAIANDASPDRFDWRFGVKAVWPYKNPRFVLPYRQSGYKAMSSRPRKKIGLCLRPPCRLIQWRIGAG
jgi:hypothetical protein